MHVGISAMRIAAALGISFVLAVPLGLLLGSSRRVDRVARPIIYLTYPVPKIVFLPIVFIIFGLGDVGKIAMLSIILFFQLLITSRDAARAVSKSARYSLYSLGGTRYDLFQHVIWPSCLPAIFTALRIATGTVVAVLFFVAPFERLGDACRGAGGGRGAAGARGRALRACDGAGRRAVAGADLEAKLLAAVRRDGQRRRLACRRAGRRAQRLGVSSGHCRLSAGAGGLLSAGGSVAFGATFSTGVTANFGANGFSSCPGMRISTSSTTCRG